MSDLERLSGLLAELGTVAEGDEESVLVRVGTTSASVRLLAMPQGLTVVSMTQLVARAVTNDERLRDLLEERGAGLSFGSLRRRSPHDRHTDVLLLYAFPLGDLDDIPLLTVLHMVLSGGTDLAEDLAH
ncbi:MAG TPA: hypothetical protein PK331_15875 [Gordonia sp. (in: high G+C Gram-positive bacteria)]|uniref:hypothetical protein n=1 Tax=unclassified Gordonia (in: high G+C Gram-positive bacteria) TaxID=2657482 RepID=UPI000FB17D94|nr:MULTISPECIES: hypothetical protein [unclassified Gordonia (in: high G+C Gram-positive bacteria)]RUP41577.1 MAG: hypothetical protein EKK60_00730 [Gordonia sp. (in: high G+C Gram-positive bacteria)]HNP56669.1 hypothetical protein [Gordonia sp. (in: high G+C Gram-positive bacteria)]HRC52390.1 hypothetical protein [Gordonia sp. (in: high G+C Gram-positive bacteria)]